MYQERSIQWNCVGRFAFIAHFNNSMLLNCCYSMEGCWKTCFYSPNSNMQPTDRVHTSHVLSMTRGAMLGTKAELNFVPVNSLVMLVPGHQGSSFFLVFVPAPGVPDPTFPPCFSYHFTCNFGPCSSCLTIKLANMLLEPFLCPTAV